MKTDIVFIITGLNVGGAEMMLLKLLSRLDRNLFAPKVISLVAHPVMMKKFYDIDIPVTNLAVGKGLSLAKGLGQLLKILYSCKPHIVQTWMYHADLLGGICAKLAGNQPIIWNIRHSDLDEKVDKKSTILTAKTCARLSYYLPDRIVCCSETAKSIHAELGYDHSKIVVIPNGFDLNHFRPNSDARQKLRKEFGISDSQILIGLIGRFHPQKDHHNFIQAAAKLALRIKDAEFLLCGKDMVWQNKQLTEMIEGTGLRKSFHLVGVRDDIPALTASLDIATSASSCGEGFSNTIGEAMACGVPCVVTDVGDSALIVGSTGLVVPPGMPEALAKALLDLVNMGEVGRRALGCEARTRIENNFSLAKIVDLYQKLYLQTVH
ncbi:MAG: glycosyltransferase [Desulfuromonadales bacterium]|nr:glycosyltransferase [Desulfuromonadales bacterium]